MSSLECVYNAKINCCEKGNCTDKMCPDTHHCCVQDAENPVLGLCVKRDEKGGKKNCNKKTGLPNTDCRDNSNPKKVSKEGYEYIDVGSKEGFNTDYLTIGNGLKFLLIVAVLVLLFVYVFYRKF